MAQMNISSTLYNDTSEGVIAFAEQLRQQLINWNEYPHVLGELGQDRPNLQNDLNALFLSVYEKFLTFLNDADATSSAINTWKEIERFLADYADTGTLKEIVDQLNANIESRLNVVLENSTGSSTTNGMSQKAITDALGAKQDVIQDLSNIRSGVAKVGYYECPTQGSSAAKAISADNYMLSAGGSMKVKMVNANTADNATLNINNTGARPLYYAGERASANNSWEAGETVEIYYDGTSYYANSVASGSGDGAFDISAKTGQNYETLNDALTAANSVIPTSKKKGGMSIKFIKPILATYSVEVEYDVTEVPSLSTSIDNSLIPAPGIYNSEDLENIPNLPSVLNTYKIYYAAIASSDNPAISDRYNVMTVKKLTNESGEYLQYRLKSTTWSTNVANWQGVDEEPVDGSKNLIESGGVNKSIQNVKDEFDSDGVFESNGYNVANIVVAQGGTSFLSSNNHVQYIPVKTGDVIKIFYPKTTIYVCYSQKVPAVGVSCTAAVMYRNQASLYDEQIRVETAPSDGYLCAATGNAYQVTFAKEKETFGSAMSADLQNLSDKIGNLQQENETSELVSVDFKTINSAIVSNTNYILPSSNYKTIWFKAIANVKYYINVGESTNIYYGASQKIPAKGISISNYATAPETSLEKIWNSDCYMCVSVLSGIDITVKRKTFGIGLDVSSLKKESKDFNRSLLKKENFPLESKYISDGSDERFPAGSLVDSDGWESSLLVPVTNIAKIVYRLLAQTPYRAFAIAFYDENKVFIDGLKSDSLEATELSASDFPLGTVYIRVSTQVNTGVNVDYYPNKDLLTLEDEVTDLKEQSENVLNPLDIYWAACGDSITHANNLTPLAVDDVYRPIDDYTDKTGIATSSGAYPNYVYNFCRKHRIQWANYGYGGTILGTYVPKYVGEDNHLYPFVENRITMFKTGITWNYITVLFGWNDNMYGPIYQRDKWLTETYGEDLGYPMTQEQIGTAGFANATQKAACDAVDNMVFFDAFIGTINDTGTDTYYGAYNYALDYLMKHYKSAKIMLIVPFIGNSDRTYSQKFRTAVIAIAQKYGVPYCDINDLPYWYFTTVMNQTPFRNPDRQDGLWVKDNGETAPATIEGYNRARFCADSVHPNLLGHEVLSEPVGLSLLGK